MEIIVATDNIPIRSCVPHSQITKHPISQWTLFYDVTRAFAMKSTTSAVDLLSVPLRITFVSRTVLMLLVATFLFTQSIERLINVMAVVRERTAIENIIVELEEGGYQMLVLWSLLLLLLLKRKLFVLMRSLNL